VIDGVASPLAVKRKRCPPSSVVMWGTIRTWALGSNSWNSWTTLPNPRRSHSKREPLPGADHPAGARPGWSGSTRRSCPRRRPPQRPRRPAF
jgi:hypothetical protein